VDAQDDDEEARLREVALKNATSILAARQRAERELIQAKEALERRTSELAKSLALIRATLESTTDGIVVINSEGQVADYNDNFLQLWRLQRSDATATAAHDLLEAICQQFDDPAAALEQFEAIERSALPHSLDVVHLADGRVFERSSKPQRVGSRNVGRVWSFRDVTAVRRADEERQQLLESERAARKSSERMSALKDQFLATLSHELRTPLNAILGWAQMLRHGTRAQATLDKGLETIERNAQLQAQLVDDLLDVSRIIAGKVRLDIQPTDPSSVIEAALETVRPAAEAKGILIQKVLDGGCVALSADPNRLQQVLWNLFSNAIKFTPKGGRVQVVLERVSSHIEISVTDNGIGIKPEFLPHVFERFQQADATTTRHYGGLGLGLSIVRHLVELHGGSITADSPGEGLGASFRVAFPIMVVHQTHQGEGAMHPATLGSALNYQTSDLSGLAVLVVDDEPDAREMLKLVLADCGARVSTAGSAEEALAHFRGAPPDVLISDIGMPDIDGYELLKRARALAAANETGFAAIALTAFARPEDRTRTLRAGFLMHLSKPVHSAELVAAIASVASRSAGGKARPASP
jgi:signal transduction histidine kinase/CheY-like chemotaxis protein